MTQNEPRPEVPDPESPASGASGPSRNKGRVVVAGSAVEFSGPIPPPSVLQKYNDVCPGCAERILTMAEKEADHRRRMEEEVIAIQRDDMGMGRRERRQGQWLGFLLCLVALVGGVYAITQSPGIAGQIGGSILGASGLTSLVIALRTGRARHTKTQGGENG